MNRLQCEVWLRTKFRRAIITTANLIRNHSWERMPDRVHDRMDDISNELFEGTEAYDRLADVCVSLLNDGWAYNDTIEELIMVFAMVLTLIEYGDDEILSDEALIDMGVLDDPERML